MNAIPPHASSAGERRTFAEMWQPYHAASGSHTRTVSTQRSWLVESARLVDSFHSSLSIPVVCDFGRGVHRHTPSRTPCLWTAFWTKFRNPIRTLKATSPQCLQASQSFGHTSTPSHQPSPSCGFLLSIEGVIALQ